MSRGSSVLERTFAQGEEKVYLSEIRTRRRDAMARRRYVSIKEVAARAGVSFQTASKGLNGGGARVPGEPAERNRAPAAPPGDPPDTHARGPDPRAPAPPRPAAPDTHH